MGFSREDLLREQSWRRCKGKSPDDVEAFLLFCDLYAKIRHPEHGVIDFAPREAQQDIIQSWMTEPRSIVLKARQIGYSTLVAVYALWLVLFWPNRLVVFLSRTQDAARQLLGIAIFAYDQLPEWFQKRGPKRKSFNVDTLTFLNGSSIASLPSKKNAGRGRSVSLAVLDEWAFFENPEEAWSSIEPITTIGGRVIGLSTANGSGNFFHEMWTRAVAGHSDFKPMFKSWRAVTERDDVWYESQCRNLPEWQRAQEYPNDDIEAFIKSGRPVFDTDALLALPTEQPARGSLHTTHEQGKGAVFLQNDIGWLRIWKQPEQKQQYVVGADVAAGLGHGDFSSAHVIEVRSGLVVAKWHGHAPPDIFAIELAKLGWLYNTALLGVEANSFGLNTNRDLQKLRYPRIFVRRALNEVGAYDDVQNTIGWYTSSVTKPILVGDLEKALRTGTVVLRDAETIKELITYVRDEKGATNGSPFDDQVISLGIANQMVQYIHNPEYVQAQSAPTKSWDWFLERELEMSGTEVERMGASNVRSEF